jgi:predicted alpha-1,2-mannosidase
VGQVRRPCTRPGLISAGLACLASLAVLPSAATLPAAGVAAAATALPGAPGGSDLASLVDPFVGTASGGPVVGAIDTFPGADVPFGMVQWSPDTSPDRASGGGYTYTDSRISGFSLTHLSGAGCTIFGDVPILPTTGAVPTSPGTATEPFSHATERASPGRYQVSVGLPATRVQLSVTTRSGIGEFDFPPTTAANLLFKVSGSESGIHMASVRTVGSHEIEGSVNSGFFCSTLESYTLHFVAVFNQPFTGHGTWTDRGLSPGSSSCSGSFQVDCGAWVTFDTARAGPVKVKVGLSYVSVANAAANLRAEDPGWSLTRVESAATRAWNSILARIGVQGGTPAERQTFYTALYHSLLDPSTFSDDNGQYEGFDGRVHSAHGRTQYANYSEWDIYRSEIPLLSMIDLTAVSDMMQSLVNDASQSGRLPVLAVADGDAGVMDGDSADPIIADTYAFGVRGFDARGALADMLKGARDPGTGPDQVPERPNLAAYLKLGFVPQDDTDPDSVGETVGASETLEYAIDDFAIARLAQSLGDATDARTMMARAQNWQHLFNPATGYIEARGSDGSFPPGPAMQYMSAAAIAANDFQPGFAEGNAIQYTWSVPQDLSRLFSLMGGDAAATADLNQYFTALNVGPWTPQDWAGNEPSLWTPWEFDYSGAPWRTQEVVRSIATTLYSPSPAGEPGNDDLGAMASWYVWAALGLYPLTPGTANLVIASPMFPSATVHLARGKVLRIEAAGAPDTYVASATLSTGPGARRPLDRPWLPAGLLRTGGTVRFVLSPVPNTSWGAAPGAAPPSYGASAAPAVGFTEPSGSVKVARRLVTAVTLGAQSDSVGATTLYWRASPSSGVAISPATGVLRVGAETPDGTYGRASTTVHVTAETTGTHEVRFTFSDPGHDDPVAPVTLEVRS